MLALPTSEPCSENLKCESTFANYKVLRKFTVFLLGGPATSLPEGAFNWSSPAPPITGTSAALFRETRFMAAQIQTWITGSLLCFHYKHTGFRLQPFPHAELHRSPMCWEPSGRNPTITEQCTIQTWPECNFSLNFLGFVMGSHPAVFQHEKLSWAWKFWKFLKIEEYRL